MVSKKKYVITIIAVILLTTFATISVGNVFLVQIGNRVIVPAEEFNEMKTYVDKYSKQESIMQHVKQNFLYDAEDNVMMDGALKGMLNSLGDPYTEYLTKREFDSLMEQTEGSYEGIGVYITPSDDNRIMIVAPIEDTPAEKAGLRTGDKIIKINGTEFTAEQMDEAVKIMKGMPDTKVTLTIKRESATNNSPNANAATAEMFDVDITREKIKLITVKPALLKDNIGYIRITTFDQLTADDFKDAYKKLEKQNIKGLVIDLRYNPGGLIDTSVAICDMLMGDSIITYTQTKQLERQYYKSDANKINIPVVLLVNEGSASASEIMAGAIKDTQSGILIGTKTFGKGIVQRIQQLGKDGTGLKMTVSEYFTPNGINIHGIGIEPDIKVELPKDAEGYGYEYYDTDTQLQKAVEVINEKVSKQ